MSAYGVWPQSTTRYRWAAADSREASVAWFRNYYRCAGCGLEWTDDWSCMCDDDCPHCGARHMSPYESEDRTEVVESRWKAFVVLRSPDTAEHTANYEEVGRFATREEAESYLQSI